MNLTEVFIFAKFHKNQIIIKKPKLDTLTFLIYVSDTQSNYEKIEGKNL